MWTQIRLLSDLGLHCLSATHLKHFSRRQNRHLVVIGILRVKYSYSPFDISMYDWFLVDAVQKL